MILRSWFGTLAESTPFTDTPLGVHWEEVGTFIWVLWDEGYRVGQVQKMFDKYRTDPFWAEASQEFNTEEEAKAWLVAMYKMGGANEPRRHRRPAKK